MNQLNLVLNFKIVLVFILFFMIFSRCKKSNENEYVSNKISSFQEIDSLYKSIDPSKIDYLFNDKRANQMQQQMSQVSYPEKLNLELLLTKELLRCNKIEEAKAQVESIKRVLDELGIELPIEISQKFKILDATIFLRQGELENCIDNHHSTSCIMPFSEFATHRKKEGSERAINILKEVLVINSENYQAIWLLNLAFETLNKDKNLMDKQFRIDLKIDHSIKKWDNISSDLGIDFNGLAGGVITDDFNNDGYSDIVISSWGEGATLKYYELKNDGSFLDKTKSSGLDKVYGSLNINQTDYNNDGYLDIFVMRGGWFESEGRIPNSLLKNNGDGTFTDVTEKAGLKTYAPTQSSVWFDVDQDGWLDLFVANESGTRFQVSSELWMNQKDGTFKNLISGSGIESIRFYKGCAVGDVNLDGKLDLYISDFKGANKLYLNESGNGKLKFVDISSKSKIERPLTSFSCWFFDYDNDGKEDIFVASYGADEGNSDPSSSAGRSLKGINIRWTPIIYHNEGNMDFQRLPLEKGINFEAFAMGSNYGDIDNDGYLDVYLSTGDPAIASIVPNMVYQNKEGKKFEDISFSTGMAHLQKGHGVGFADFDRDGDEDLYVVLGGAYEGDSFQNAFFQNPNNRHNWITLTLEGKQSNRKAIGANVRVVVEEKGMERSIYRRVSSGSSFGGNSLDVEVGLGKAEKILKVEVTWPIVGNVKEIYEGLEINSSYRLKEGGIKEKINRKELKFEIKEGGHHNHQH